MQRPLRVALKDRLTGHPLPTWHKQLPFARWTLLLTAEARIPDERFRALASVRRATGLATTRTKAAGLADQSFLRNAITRTVLSLLPLRLVSTSAQRVAGSGLSEPLLRMTLALVARRSLACAACGN